MALRNIDDLFEMLLYPPLFTDRCRSVARMGASNRPAKSVHVDLYSLVRYCSCLRIIAMFRPNHPMLRWHFRSRRGQANGRTE
jgi:hypothetical protein